jgi:hypothetical protein
LAFSGTALVESDSLKSSNELNPIGDRMKSILSMVLIVLLLITVTVLVSIDFSSAQNPTNVNGIIRSDTTWTKASSPYIFTGPIAVNNGVTLTIEPGTTVNLNNYYMQVNGTLQACGSIDEPITFTGGLISYIEFTPLSKSWDEQTKSGSVIENALINAMVQITNVSPKIDGNNLVRILVDGGSSNISKNTITEGITVNDGSPVISNNIKIGGIDLAGGFPVISNNNVTSSNDEFHSYAAIIIGGGSPAIASNNITSRIDQTSALAPYNSPSLIHPGISTDGADNASIFDNTIYGCSIGVRAGSVSNIKGNAIFNNSIGLEVDSKVTVYDNLIANNSIGIKLKYDSATIVDNNIYCNTQNSIYLESISGDVDLANNWWGTVDEFVINQSIFDNKNNFNLGVVNFVPFLIQPNPQAPQYPNFTNTPASTLTPALTLSPTLPTSTTTTNPSSTPSLSALPSQQSSPMPTISQAMFYEVIGILAVATITLTVVVVILLHRLRKQVGNKKL